MIEICAMRILGSDEERFFFFNDAAFFSEEKTPGCLGCGS